TSASEDIADPPSISPTNIEESVPQDNHIVAEEVDVELQIRQVIQLLSNYIGDISGDEKISYDQMDEYNAELKKCIASIEAGLSQQLNILEESLMSTDVNCCRALYDHQIEVMNEMYQQFNEILREKVLYPIFENNDTRFA
uniref:Uncharacterized protein n=1 Tax=Panagrolaimus sp. ES5 TaxID=591445 RepID=A0AC34G808_9BILA